MMVRAPAALQREGSHSHVQVRGIRSQDVPVLVAFWNRAFAGRRNFHPISVEEYRRRILDCPACDAAGLILAWQRDGSGVEALAGMVHAFRPPEPRGHYRRWAGSHAIAVLYVDPERRNQGIGSRLLQAAENWLYYCPVEIGGQALPCYGGVEGPQAPFFGSPQHLGVSARDTELLRFLSQRGYHVVQPGDVSLSLDLAARPAVPPQAPDLRVGPGGDGLSLVAISHESPFTGHEEPERVEYSLWGDNGGNPYAGLVLVDGGGLLRGAIHWLPLASTDRAGIGGFWIAPELRGRGLGAFLLDQALYEMATAPRAEGSRSGRGGYASVEVLTHLVRHARAVKLYESRGFLVDEAWVHLVKT